MIVCCKRPTVWFLQREANIQQIVDSMGLAASKLFNKVDTLSEKMPYFSDNILGYKNYLDTFFNYLLLVILVCK